MKLHFVLSYVALVLNQIEKKRSGLDFITDSMQFA